MAFERHRIISEEKKLQDCYSDSQCMRTISYCDNSKGGVLSKVVSGKLDE